MKMGIYLVMFLASVARLGTYAEHQHSGSTIDFINQTAILQIFFYFTSLIGSSVMFLLEIHFCLKSRFETFALSYKTKRLPNLFYSAIYHLSSSKTVALLPRIIRNSERLSIVS